MRHAIHMIKRNDIKDAFYSAAVYKEHLQFLKLLAKRKNYFIAMLNRFSNWI